MQSALQASSGVLPTATRGVRAIVRPRPRETVTSDSGTIQLPFPRLPPQTTRQSSEGVRLGVRGADPQASLLEIQILEIWGGGPGSCTFVPGDFFFLCRGQGRGTPEERPDDPVVPEATAAPLTPESPLRR